MARPIVDADGVGAANAAGRRGSPQALWLLSLALTAIAALVVATARPWAEPGFGIEAPWAAVVLAFVLAEAVPGHVQRRHRGWQITFTEAAVVLGFFTLTLPELLAAQFTVGAVGYAVSRTAPVKVVVNLSQHLAATSIGWAVFDLLSTGTAPVASSDWLAAAAGAGAANLVSLLSVSAAIRLSRQAEGRRTWQFLVVSLVAAAAATVAGIVVASELAGHADPVVLALLATLALVAGAVAAVRYTVEQRRTGLLQLLVRTSQVLETGDSRTSPVTDVLAEAREVLAVERAALYAWARQPSSVMVTTAQADGTTAPDVRPMDTTIAAIRLVAERGDVVEQRSRDLGHRHEGIFGDGPESGILVPVRDHDETVGALVLTGRPANVRSFDRDERATILAVASQLGLILRSDHLDAAISAAMDLRDELDRRTRYDSLTGLRNRQGLREHLLSRMEGPESGPVALLLIDVDDFSIVNDALGHQAGDEVLQAIADRLVRTLGRSATVARAGGDEFAVVLDVASSLEPVHQAITQVRAVMDEPIVACDRRLRLPGRIGVAVVLDHGTSADDLISNADIALARARTNRVEEFVVYRPDMRRDLLADLTTRGQLHAAVETTGAFPVHYQPVVDLDNGQPIGLEALVRWRHPTQGIVPPAAFLEHARRAGLLRRIGATVIHTACHDVAGWQALCPNGIDVTINLSEEQITDPALAETVLAALAGSGLPAHRLILEVDAAGLAGRGQREFRQLLRLRTEGVRIALQGADGSLDLLALVDRAPLDILKLARPAVAALHADGNDAVVVRALVDVGRRRQLTIVAEGIEYADQRRRLQDLACDGGQGFLFAKPMAPSAVEDFLRTRVPAP